MFPSIKQVTQNWVQTFSYGSTINTFVEIQPESFRDGHSLYSVPPFAVRSAGKIKRAASRQVWRKQIMRLSGNGPFLTTTEEDHLCSTTLLEDKSRKMCFFFISNHLTESQFKITREFKSFCPEGLMGGTCTQQQTCMRSGLANTHTVMNKHACPHLLLHIRLTHNKNATSSFLEYQQGVSEAGRRIAQQGGPIISEPTEGKECPIPCERSALITFFYSREHICDGS